MKSCILFSSIFLYYTSIFSANPSSLLVIHNTTKLDMELIIEGIYHPDNDQEIYVDFNVNKDQNITIECNLQEDKNEQTYMYCKATLACKPESITTLHPMLFCNEIACDLRLQSIICNNHHLQLQTFYNIRNKDQKYVIIEYNSDNGIHLTVQPFSWYANYAHRFKIMLQAILTKMLQATEYLPY
jgi:hypothetical protein